MKQELQEQLFAKYPKIFKQHSLPMQQTCMCWGIECGDGWYTLIDTLCQCLEHIQSSEGPHIEAAQVKEKYGGLRFYADHGSSEQWGAIAMAEAMSEEICEACGSTDRVEQSDGWIETRCKRCKKGQGNDTY